MRHENWVITNILRAIIAMHVTVDKIVLACNNGHITSICKNIEFKLSAGLRRLLEKRSYKKF